MSHHNIESQIAYALVEGSLASWERRAYKDANRVREELEVAHYAFAGAVYSGAKKASCVSIGAGIGFCAGYFLSSALDVPPLVNSFLLAIGGGFFGYYFAPKNRGVPFSEFRRLSFKVSELESQLRGIERTADYQSAVGKVESKSLVL